MGERFHLKKDLSAVFIDSWAKMPFSLDDPVQQEAFARETQKLWNVTTHLDSFAFKTLEDVLEEYSQCMKTVDEDIAAIKAELLIVQQNFTNVDSKFDDFEIEIISNKMSSEEADQCIREDLVQNVSMLKDEIATNKVSIEHNEAEIHQTEEKVQGEIDDVSRRLDEESIARTQEDENTKVELQNNLNTEISARTSQDQVIKEELQTSLEKEVSDRKTQDQLIFDTVETLSDDFETIQNLPRFVAVLQPSSNDLLPCNDIKGYNNLLVNKGDVFNAATGVFHSPCDGKFKFFIDAYGGVIPKDKDSYYYADLAVLVNDEIVKTLDVVTSTVSEEILMIEGTIFLDLKYGQEVKLSNRKGDLPDIYDVCLVQAGPSYPLIFSGYQII